MDPGISQIFGGLVEIFLLVFCPFMLLERFVTRPMVRGISATANPTGKSMDEIWNGPKS